MACASCCSTAPEHAVSAPEETFERCTDSRKRAPPRARFGAKSLCLTLRALREARAFDRLEECFRLEFRLISRLVGEHDFSEGVRAALIDKDRQPKWKPAGLSAVSAEVADVFFASLGLGELQL